jgi:hypothetical protein
MATYEDAMRQFDQALKDIVRDVAFETHRKVIENTPVAESTPGNEYIQSHTGGRLRESIRIEKDSDGNWLIGTNVPYAEFVELDTNPHLIAPRFKKALAFYDKRDKDFKVIPHAVMHPGTKGRAMFLNGAIEAENILKEVLSKPR